MDIKRTVSLVQTIRVEISWEAIQKLVAVELIESGYLVKAQWEFKPIFEIDDQGSSVVSGGVFIQTLEDGEIDPPYSN